MGGPWGGPAGQVRPGPKRRRPSRSAHTLVYARGTKLDSRLCPPRVCEPSSRGRRSLGGAASPATRRLPDPAPVSPPLSSRHVSPHHPISVRSAQARDSNCGAASSRGSALGRPPPPPLRTGHGAPHRGARPVPGHQAGEWACGDLGEAAGPAISGPGRRPRTGQSSPLQGWRGATVKAVPVLAPAAVLWTTLKERLAGSGAQHVGGGCSFVPETLALFSAVSDAFRFKAPERPG